MMFGIILYTTPVDNLYAFFREVSVLVLCLYLKEGYLWGFLVFVWYWIVRVLYISILTSYQIYGLQTFSLLYVAVLFCSLFPSLCKSFWVWCNFKCPFLFLCLCFWCHSQEIPANTNVKNFTLFPCSSFRASSLCLSL